jgi:geranylgeranylglycerol-phosphate geranylgeranyltransferase
MPSNLNQFLLLTRPFNLLLGFVSVFLGAFITGTIDPVWKVALACLSAVLVMAGGNVINDYFDVEIDRINKAFRPIAAGKIGRTEAFLFTIILFALGIFVSIFISLVALLIVLLTATGLVFYSAKLKRKILVGNIAVSLFAALAFVYGAVSVDRWHRALIPAGFAFLFHLGREIIKDVEDQAADNSCALQTLPIKYGRQTAFSVVTVVFAVLIVFTFVPYLLNIYGVLYFWTVLIGVDLVIVAVLIMMWTRPEPQSLRQISGALKADMLIGLMAIYLGQFGTVGLG